jgi:hypothetical protein
VAANSQGKEGAGRACLASATAYKSVKVVALQQLLSKDHAQTVGVQVHNFSACCHVHRSRGLYMVFVHGTCTYLYGGGGVSGEGGRGGGGGREKILLTIKK